ncbi:DUF3309 domain-containing protein [Methylobacterium planeticum]|uniref:DUF3309 domain-containing protein n=1 Tax=Methylobacterium planeticum TaxID=2615211 RepID=A0A6N6MUM7_9HYPH|nr:DUF3309 domain-containing protein [Methylobacterium planeticum]KAB1073431.1 DUF3309 domain-containing protein [Methylobacterium planeticum]
MITILLILLILAAFGGGFYGTGGAYPYRTGGWSLGGILVVVLIVLLVMGRV